jgi:hypothetical protein
MVILVLSFFWRKIKLLNLIIYKNLIDVGINSIFNQIINQEKADIKIRIALLNYTYSFYIFKNINKDNISNYTLNNSTYINLMLQ